MKWKKRRKLIRALFLKHGTDRRLARPFPDLRGSDGPRIARPAPTSDRIFAFEKWKRP
jgi:hypothetical protein